MNTDYTNQQCFEPGDRVELHPATDLWMRGARYAIVQKVRKGIVTILVDGVGRRSTTPANLRRVNREGR